MFHFRRTDPHPILRDYIKGYWLMEKQDSEAGIPLQLVPDGYPELIFSYGTPFRLARGGQVQHLNVSSMLGQLTSSLEMQAEVGSRAFFVKMYPWVPALIFDLPPENIVDQAIDLELLGPYAKIRSLGTLLRSASSFEESVKLVENFLIHEVKLPEKKHPILSFASRQILQHKGRISMEELGRQIKLSHRYIEKVFKKGLGIPPKRFARLIRTKDVSCRLLKPSHADLSTLAQTFGYFDQSHFIRDFKSITHFTPGAYRHYMEKFPIHEVDDYLLQFQ